MDIPFWFWTSITTGIITTIIGITNAVTWLSCSNRLKVWPVYVHVACCIAWLLASWGVLGFGIAWIVMALKS